MDSLYALLPAIIALFGILYGVWKGVRFAVHVEDALPILFKVAAEFEPNGGGSMRDRIDTIADEQKKVRDELVTHTRQDQDRFNDLTDQIEGLRQSNSR